ncbi:hypothetical protein EIG75_23145 [Pseudomonas syringae]|uniref:MoxR-vWA-beta-propeller ternary system domain-containing protein n=1 Tax=Pseudomonas syringae TaxID=317 RepID=A0A6B2AXK5_PSESX|nr:hypothetical protein [Pseudomonas syringae]MBI6561235.1 hypothetical protein [Pseudomonas syringae]MBI6572188.1 hypothetical protein [Pseudomonas syringae]MBI6587268.1 hypothetical protein [Pseudomonas syringae]MBI6592365.1 hypothetical protein [Pseudomonas syringae]MDC6490629.1 hypothetical protein [Pseudomonas syringae]
MTNSVTAAAIDWNWRVRREPGQPQAAVAWGEVAARLHARLLRMPEDQTAQLQATANCDVLIVTGNADDLPWVEGVDYACTEPAAPGLWLPTSWEPDAPLDLMGQALLGRFARTPLLLWHAPKVVVPLDRCLPLTARHLQRIQNRWAGR